MADWKNEVGTDNKGADVGRVRVVLDKIRSWSAATAICEVWLGSGNVLLVNRGSFGIRKMVVVFKKLSVAEALSLFESSNIQLATDIHKELLDCAERERRDGSK